MHVALQGLLFLPVLYQVLDVSNFQVVSPTTDRVAIALMLALSLLIGLLLWQGAPRVRDFSWQDKQVGAEDTSLPHFSRPMTKA